LIRSPSHALDLQYAQAGGNLQTKEQCIAAVTAGPPRYESFTFSDTKVKFYGEAAILTAGMTKEKRFVRWPPE
jgi:Domain of unknown function (DUF4440)